MQAKAYQSNVTDFEAAQNLVADVLKEFESIDILINNAGITKDNLLMRIAEEDFDKVIEVNLKSVCPNDRLTIRVKTISIIFFIYF